MTEGKAKTRLQVERENRHLTQAELAEEIGATTDTVSRWERGGQLPRPYHKRRLSAFFGMEVDDLWFHKEVSEESLSSLWNVPYRRSPYFTGRDALFPYLHAALESGKTTALTQAISGLGGIGKTQVAVEYAYRFGSEYKAILWVQADSETLALSMVSLARVLDLVQKDEQDQHQVIEAVKRWLDTHSGWLLIFDGVEDVTKISVFLPQKGKGHILFTSRTQAVGPLANRIDIETLEREEGATLLLRRAKLIEADGSLGNASADDRDNTKKLAELMDGLPLALDQAGAYIEETKCGVAKYLDLFQTRRSELLRRRGSIIDGHPASVTTTFSISFEKIAQVNPAAVELLRFCAFLHPNSIPEEIITTGASDLGPLLQLVAVDPIRLNNAIEEILKYSLMHRNTDATILSIHRLVQVVLQDEMDKRTQDLWIERTVQAVARVLPPTETDIQLFEKYIPHAQICAELIEQREFTNEAAAHILYMVGFYFRERARYPEAKSLCQRALELYEQKLGPEHREVANCLNNLALVYEETGMYAGAEPLFRRALNVLERLLPPEHPDLAGILNNMARCYRFQDKLLQAEPLCRRSLAILEKTLGPDHIDLAPTLNTLASIYRDQGQYMQAEPLYLRALAIRENNLPPEHLDIAYSLNALATNYAYQGDFARAGELNQRALAIFEKVRGPEHPDVALCLTCLSDSYFFQGKHDQARLSNQRALAIYEKVVGAEHPDAAQAIGNLAVLYEMEDEYAQADVLYQRALVIKERALGSEHLDLVPILQLYAGLLRKTGQENEAIKLEARARAIQAKHARISRAE